METEGLNETQKAMLHHARYRASTPNAYCGGKSDENLQDLCGRGLMKTVDVGYLPEDTVYYKLTENGREIAAAIEREG